MKVTNQLFPTEKHQLKAMQEKGPDGPIFMVNLLKFKDKAEYEDKSENTLSGREAYQRYAVEVSKLVEKYGGVMFFVADVTHLTLGLVDELWDEVAIVIYPNRKALVDMSTSPEWMAVAHHRAAGLDGQLNIETTLTPDWQQPDWLKKLLESVAKS